MIKRIKQKAILLFLTFFLIFGGGLALGAPSNCGFSDLDTRSINARIAGKTSSERSDIKSCEIAKIDFQGVYVDTTYGVTMDIQSIKEIEGGIEIFLKARMNGKRVGFGKDGTVEIERFLIYNPPILVSDPNGEVVIERSTETVESSTSTPILGKTWRTTWREDPAQTIRNVLAHNITLVGKGDENIVSGKRGSTVSTFFPEPHVETDTVDGYIVKSNSTSWDTTHDATSGSSNDAGSTSLLIWNTRFITQYQIRRVVSLFKTEAITDSDIISAAVLSYYITATSTSGDNDGNAFISIVQVTNGLAADTTIVNADFNQVGDAVDNPTEGIDSGDRVRIEDMAGGYEPFPLNATGIAWIAKNGETKPSGATAGITYLGSREGHDILDDPPSSGGELEVVASSADETAGSGGTDQDPKLVVTHTAVEGGTLIIIISAFKAERFFEFIA